MPSDEAYDAVLRELGKLVDALRSQREELTESLRQHRDVVFRAINLLNHEVIGFTQRLDKDDQARTDRQSQVDSVLRQITDNQAQQRRWQWIRLGLELIAIAMVTAYLFGVSR